MTCHSNDHHTTIAGAGRGTFKSYLVGFILSVILTLIPFWMVMDSGYSSHLKVLSVVLFAIVQLIVQLYYFMHLNSSSDQRWNLSAFLFVITVVAILIVGSLWIMYHLNLNMMYM